MEYFNLWLTAALLFLCALLQCNAAGWESVEDEGYDPISLSPNNNSMSYVEPFFCTSDDVCKLDIKKGVEIKAKWTVKVPQGKKIVFDSHVGVIIDLDNAYLEDASLKVEDYTTGVEITDTTFEEYTKVTITTSGTLQADDVENGTLGDVWLFLRGTSDEKSEWAIRQVIEIAEDSE